MYRRCMIMVVAVLFTCAGLNAQKIEQISFNLYTDSLKKEVHNYISVDGKLDNGRYIPLDSKQITFTASYGKWEGNDLIIDKSYTKDSIVVTATLKDNPTLSKTVTIYMKKITVEPPLRTLDEIMHEPAKKRKKNNR